MRTSGYVEAYCVKMLLQRRERTANHLANMAYIASNVNYNI